MAPRKTSKHSKARTMLRLADLEQSKNAVLHSLGAASSQESYGHAIDEFIGWYCSAPRLAFNRTVVLRYRFFLEQKNLAPSTINVRLAAARSTAGWSENSSVTASRSSATNSSDGGNGIGLPTKNRAMKPREPAMVCALTLPFRSVRRVPCQQKSLTSQNIGSQ